jgi:hypothetical protein
VLPVVAASVKLPPSAAAHAASAAAAATSAAASAGAAAGAAVGLDLLTTVQLERKESKGDSKDGSMPAMPAGLGLSDSVLRSTRTGAAAALPPAPDTRTDLQKVCCWPQFLMSAELPVCAQILQELKLDLYYEDFEEAAFDSAADVAMLGLPELQKMLGGKLGHAAKLMRHLKTGDLSAAAAPAAAATVARPSAMLASAAAAGAAV